MKTNVRRSFATALAGALMAFSTGLAAQASSAVKLSDADLDQVTAGSGAISQVVIFNPGKAEVLKINGRPGAEMPSHATCINCFELDVPRTSGAVGVVLPNGGMVVKFVRQPF
jgi:hypothetical protein